MKNGSKGSKKILAVDTSSRFLCLGYMDGERICEYNVEAGVKLSGMLHPAIERTLRALDLAPEDIDYFACGVGPGSFTGLRIGVAAIKGLAWSLRKPVAAVASLDVIARNALFGEVTVTGKRYIVTAVDAKRDLLYCCIYSTSGKSLKRESPYMLLTVTELMRKVEALVSPSGKGSITFLGDACGLHREAMLKGSKGGGVLDKDYWYPQPRNVLDLALEKIEKKQLASAFKVDPLYLYPKECQIRSKSK